MLLEKNKEEEEKKNYLIDFSLNETNALKQSSSNITTSKLKVNVSYIRVYIF